VGRDDVIECKPYVGEGEENNLRRGRMAIPGSKRQGRGSRLDQKRGERREVDPNLLPAKRKEEKM